MLLTVPAASQLSCAYRAPDNFGAHCHAAPAVKAVPAQINTGAAATLALPVIGAPADATVQPASCFHTPKHCAQLALTLVYLQDSRHDT